ncbi:hypothetical protein D3C81_2090700 [compost metagenome]
MNFNGWLVAVLFQRLAEVLVYSLQVSSGFEVMELTILLILGCHVAFGALDIIQRDLITFLKVNVGRVRCIASGQEKGHNRIQSNLLHVYSEIL